MKNKYLLAALAAAVLLSGCAAGRKEPVASGDVPAGTVPAQTEPASESVTAQTSESEVTTTSETTAYSETTVPSADAPPSSETTADPLGFTYDAFSAKMYATDTLNVREYPSTEAKIVGQLNPGDEAAVIGKTPSGWYVVDYNGGKACVYGEYLSAEEPVIEEEELAVPENYYFDSEDDYFFVVNKDKFLPDDYSIETDYVQGSYELETVAAYYCKKMIDAAEKDGINLKVLSAYRTVEYQRKLFDRNVKSRMEEDGMSYDEAYYDVSINIAPPGGSEHNAGLAVDIIDTKHWDTYEAFEDTPEFAWLSEHCTEYGFILRYPKGKEDITGYIYEPWHYRYVGAKYAADVMASGLCLEEYLGV